MPVKVMAGSALEAALTRLARDARRGALSRDAALARVDAAALRELLRPRLEPAALAGLPRWSGGLTGSAGAASGRLYLSAEALLAAKREAAAPGYVLALPEALAADVPGLAAADAVISAEGGYAAHAAVLARQYGTAAVLAPGLRIRGKKALLGGLALHEGDPVSVDAPAAAPPSVYAGAVPLAREARGGPALRAVLGLARDALREAGFAVRCNADSAPDAALGRALGAEGVGLCRTEHMFFAPERLPFFQALLLSAARGERDAALEALFHFQQDDFYALLAAAAGKPVTIRLLDAPLHEFLPPPSAREIAPLASRMGLSAREARARIASLREKNPMLGLRGCRVGVVFPELYAMQVRAIMAAACRARRERKKVTLDILIPFVINERECKLIAYGRKIEGGGFAGIAGAAEAFFAEAGERAIPFRIGAMIETPAAALAAAGIARYAAFFCIGGNDLTQTALGISRDDCGSFLPAYTRADLIAADPFAALEGPAAELAETALERGRQTRPGLPCCFCGEQAASPQGARWCAASGFDSISCSSRAVPIAALAAAQTLAGG